jgi:hypothetical protein
MSPEQWEHPGEVDHRADIYALGVVFYHMLTGELPGRNLEPPSRKVRLDVRLDEIVLRALEETPERRYQQAGVLKTQVEAVAASPEAVPREPSRFSRTAIVGAWFAGLSLLGVGLFFVPTADPNGAARLLPISILLVVPAALFATILGWVSVGQIRRSGRNLHGMGLALFDGMLLPLAALYGIIALLTRQISILVLGWPLDNPVLNSIGISATTAIFALAGSLIVWRVLRMVNAPATPSTRTTAHSIALGCGILALVAFLFLLGILSLFVTWKQKEQVEVAQKMRETMEARQQAVVQAHLSSRPAHFGPIQEGLADRSGRGGLDLDSGRFVSFDPSLTGAPDIELAHRWLQAESVDLFGDPNSFRPGILLMAVAPAVLEVNEGDWDADPSSLLRRLPPPPPAGVYTDHMTFIDAPQGTGHPKTYLIRTQQGGAAIIQILGATDSRDTMYRYKNILSGS